MTELNANSNKTDAISKAPEKKLLTPAIIALATLAAVGLNVGLFMTVDGHVRSMSGRELEVARRENEVASAEARRETVHAEIQALEERLRKARIATESAEKRANEAQARKRELDQMIDEIASLNAQGAERRNELSRLGVQITQARTDETDAKGAAKNAVAQRQREIDEAESRKTEAIRSANEQEALRDRARRDADAAQKAASDATRLKTERDALARDVENARQELNERRRERDLLNSQIAGYTNEGKLLQQLETSFRAQTKNLDGQVSARTSELNELEKRIAIASQQARDAEKAAVDLQRVNAARVAALEATSRELQKAQNENTILNSEFSKRTAAIASLKDEEAAAAMKLASLVATIKRDEATRNEASQQAAARRAELNLVSADLDAARADLAQSKSMRQLIKLTEADIQKTQAAKAELENDLAKRKADLADVKRRVDDAHAALKAVEAPVKIQSDFPAE